MHLLLKGCKDVAANPNYLALFLEGVVPAALCLPNLSRLGWIGASLDREISHAVLPSGRTAHGRQGTHLVAAIHSEENSFYIWSPQNPIRIIFFHHEFQLCNTISISGLYIVRVNLSILLETPMHARFWKDIFHFASPIRHQVSGTQAKNFHGHAITLVGHAQLV